MTISQRRASQLTDLNVRLFDRLGVVRARLDNIGYYEDLYGYGEEDTAEDLTQFGRLTEARETVGRRLLDAPPPDEVCPF